MLPGWRSKMDSILDNGYYRYTFTANQNVKIASGKNVANYLIDKYGDSRIKDSYKDFNDLDLRNRGSFTYDLYKSSSDELKAYAKYADDNKEEISNFIHKTLYSDDGKKQETYRHFISDNYDGITDAEDWINGANAPVIILNQNRIKRTGVDHKDMVW